MTKSQRETVEKAFDLISALCESNSNDARLWSAIYDAAKDGEKRHRAMAPRVASYRDSIPATVRYWAVRVVVEPPKEAKVSWLGATQIRDDWRLGHALRESLAQRPIAQIGRHLVNLAEIERVYGPAILAIDYVTDIAERVREAV